MQSTGAHAKRHNVDLGSLETKYRKINSDADELKRNILGQLWPGGSPRPEAKSAATDIPADVINLLRRFAETPYLRPNSEPDAEWGTFTGPTWHSARALAFVASIHNPAPPSAAGFRGRTQDEEYERLMANIAFIDPSDHKMCREFIAVSNAASDIAKTRALRSHHGMGKSLVTIARDAAIDAALFAGSLLLKQRGHSPSRSPEGFYSNENLWKWHFDALEKRQSVWEKGYALLCRGEFMESGPTYKVHHPDRYLVYHANPVSYPGLEELLKLVKEYERRSRPDEPDPYAGC